LYISNKLTNKPEAPRAELVSLTRSSKGWVYFTYMKSCSIVTS